MCLLRHLFKWVSSFMGLLSSRQKNSCGWTPPTTHLSSSPVSQQGKSTPEHRSPAMGHYPISDIKSFIPKETVSVSRLERAFLIIL